VKFKQYLINASKKDILKRFKKLKKMTISELSKIASLDCTIDNQTIIIEMILFEEFREEDIENAFNYKDIK
jgi:hypothetical protein